MALIKVIQVGDELVFDMSNVAPNTKLIRVALCEKAGRSAVLKITADRSISIAHIKQQQLP